MKSRARSKIPGGDKKAFASGKSAFRFLVPRKAALEDPQTAKFAERYGELIIWYGADRRVVMYPCANNELLNFVCIHPGELSEVKSDGAYVLMSYLKLELTETRLEPRR